MTTPIGGPACGSNSCAALRDTRGKSPVHFGRAATVAREASRTPGAADDFDEVMATTDEVF